MARNPFKLPGLPGLPKQPGLKVYSDKNFNKPFKPKVDSDKEFTHPFDPIQQPTPNPGDNLNPEEKKARFRRLAGILGGLHKK